jgi:ComF family protein
MDPHGDADTAKARWRTIPARIASRFRQGSGTLADLVMPPVCLACHVSIDGHDALCARCWRSVSFIRPPLCDRLGLPMPYDTGGIIVSAAATADPPDFDRARAVAHYSGAMRELIRSFKFRDRHDCRRLLGRWLAEAGRDLLPGAEVVVPVPLNRWRLLSRRFNQAALLAQDLSRATGLAYAPLALERTRATASQVGKTREQRRLNVRGAFHVPSGHRTAIDGRSVILVDDVITTGATANAAARALKRAGAARVDVLALALVTGFDNDQPRSGPD